ncbi:MAG: SUMF1/EgtB/PvdO family nonheme iron enzyme, partial [Myxococcota bacterium]
QRTRRPAVEFFATWCQPCMEAVPRWEALRRRYAKQGLRFVVVAVKDDADRCADVPWHPDRILCDSDGALAERLGVKALPSAFLWSWQGHLLARGSHVDAVEASIDAWMREIPRVEIRAEVEGARAGVDAPTLRGLIAAELGVTGQLVVVASPEERKELRALARSSFAAAVDERYRCPLGKEVSANNLLQATVAHGRLRLGLLSAETHCRNGDVYSSWDPTRPEASVTRGVTKLLAGLQRRSPEGLALATRIVAPESQPEEVPAAPTPKPTPGSLGALLAEAEGRVKDAERPARERRAAEDKRREAERAALQRAWAKLDKLAFKSVLPRAERAELLTRFADNYPADHPHVISARRFLAFLEAGYEPRRDMVFVPGGTAVLGCKTPDRCDDYQEMKTTKIRVRPFFIDRTEVTVEAYDQCVRVGFCGSPAGLVDELECNSAQRDRGQHPVNCVSWTDAVAYCSYRRKTLPTEVQWEKAARGLDRRPY